MKQTVDYRQTKQDIEKFWNIVKMSGKLTERECDLGIALQWLLDNFVDKSFDDTSNEAIENARRMICRVQLAAAGKRDKEIEELISQTLNRNTQLEKSKEDPPGLKTFEWLFGGKRKKK